VKENIKKALTEEFSRDLRYYPLIHRISGITKEIHNIFDDAAERMCNEDRTSSQDINQARETINLLKIGLTTTYNPNQNKSVQQLTAKSALESALSNLCPIWPLCSSL